MLETTFSRTNFRNFPNSSQQTTGILGVSKRIVKKGERESWDSRDMTGNLGSQNLTLSTKNSRSSGQKHEKSILVMKFVDFYPSCNRNLKCSIGNAIFYFSQVFTFKQNSPRSYVLDSLRFMERWFKVSSKTWTFLGKSKNLLIATRVSTTFCLEKQETGEAIALRVAFH